MNKKELVMKEKGAATIVLRFLFFEKIISKGKVFSHVPGIKGVREQGSEVARYRKSASPFLFFLPAYYFLLN